MGTRTRISRSFFSAALGFGLLSLVFLGSPGCGCGDDDLTPPRDQRPPRCCCDFEWLPPRSANGSDVVVSIENADAALDAVVTPALLTSVSFVVAEEFTVCVNEEHVLGDQLDLVFTDQATNEEYGRARLFYKTRCMASIEPLTDGMNLVSTDCGNGEPLLCCCEFEWRPGFQDGEIIDVTIAAENVSPGLSPVITPTTLTDVEEGVIELIDVCVDASHPLGAQMDLVVRVDPGGFLVGVVQLVYDEQCIPTVVPIASAATLDITSTGCGGEPLMCCCEFEWLPPVGISGDVTIAAQNVSAGMTVEITPTSLTNIQPRQFYNFTVCINQDHNLLDAFDLVITSTAGPEIGRMRITYRERCTPTIQDILDAPSLLLTTTDCGGADILCCCDIEWLLTDPDFNPPPSPWTATLEGVDATLQTATLTPTLISFAVGEAPTTVLFTICVNPTHTLGAALDLVVRAQDVTGATIELARLPMDYVEACIPFAGDPSGFGTWNILCQRPD